MENLKPCPFCGGKAILKKHWDSGGEESLIIECSNCLARIFEDPYEKNAKEKLIQMWNRRIGQA